MEKARQHPAVTPDPGRRMRGFAWHLLAYFIVSGLAFGANMAFSPESLWFLAPVVGWGSILALHVAYVMGLFSVFSAK
jgi:hypothetical protein